MKNSRVSIATKLPPKPPQISSRQNQVGSLKAIINHGRVPLSQYIHHRGAHTPHLTHGLSYLDRIKASFEQRQLSSNREASIEKGTVNNKGMDVEQSQKVFKNYLDNFGQYEKTGKSQKNQLGNGFIPKERSKSVHNKLRVSLHKKKESLEQQSSIEPKLVACRPQTQITTSPPQYYISKCGKKVKHEKVDYRKYTPIIKSEDELRCLELEQLLGLGANATVRLGRCSRGDRRFAVKVYEKYKLIEAKKKKRVLQEIEILSRLQHPNIIKMTHCFEDKRQIHLLFEFIHEAQTLQEYIRKKAYNLPEEQKKYIAVQITKAIAYLHAKGISHRDIKTENIILGNNREVKVIDFGFATPQTKAETHCGTPSYMAPQLFQKKVVYDPMAVDIWALGVLLFYLYEGSYPFRGYSEKDLARNITSCGYSCSRASGWSRKAIESCLVVHAGARLTADELLQMLQK